MPVTPIYTTVASVQIRLAGKVAFQSGSEPTARELSNDLLNQMIVDAETAVEQDLRGRYKVPFQSVRTGNWKGLPDHSMRAIRTICDMKACILILGDSFGSGTHINADGYLNTLNKNYELLLRRLLGQDLEGSEFGEKRFRRTPPLDDMALSPTNIADDGLRGRPIDANSRPGDCQRWEPGNFASDQVNDPSRDIFWFGGQRGPY